MSARCGRPARWYRYISAANNGIGFRCEEHRVPDDRAVETPTMGMSVGRPVLHYCDAPCDAPAPGVGEPNCRKVGAQPAKWISTVAAPAPAGGGGVYCPACNRVHPDPKGGGAHDGVPGDDKTPAPVATQHAAGAVPAAGEAVSDARHYVESFGEGTWGLPYQAVLMRNLLTAYDAQARALAERDAALAEARRERDARKDDGRAAGAYALEASIALSEERAALARLRAAVGDREAMARVLTQAYAVDQGDTLKWADALAAHFAEKEIDK